MSVWVEIRYDKEKVPNATSHAPRERVSWNFNFKWRMRVILVTLHVSVWVEMISIAYHTRVTVSRSTWACELKLLSEYSRASVNCHAPRERVSWNFSNNVCSFAPLGHAPRERVSWNFCTATEICTTHVTLHVSVWVEIEKFCYKGRKYRVTLHVSVWVEISMPLMVLGLAKVTLHVSVWVEM